MECNSLPNLLDNVVERVEDAYPASWGHFVRYIVRFIALRGVTLAECDLAGVAGSEDLCRSKPRVHKSKSRKPAMSSSGRPGGDSQVLSQLEARHCTCTHDALQQLEELYRAL